MIYDEDNDCHTILMTVASSRKNAKKMIKKKWGVKMDEWDLPPRNCIIEMSEFNQGSMNLIKIDDN